MASVAKRAPKLIFAAIFLAFGLIGWVARATLAQDAPKELVSPEATPPQATPVPAPPALQDLPAPSANPAKLPDQGSQEPPFVGATSAKAEPPAPSREPAPDATNPVASVPDDPEKSALAFVEQSQKMAESQLKNLKAEEAKLRDRLRKVEAGIKRWDSLLGALKQSQGSVAVVSPANSGNWKQADQDERVPQRLAPADDELAPPLKTKPIGVKK